MENGFKDELTERLMRYTAIDSQSDELSNKSPSTDQQLDMLNLLKEELLALGVEDVKLTDYGVVLATVPGNISTSCWIFSACRYSTTIQCFRC